MRFSFKRSASRFGLLLLATAAIASAPLQAEPLHQTIDRLITSQANGPLAAPSSDEEFVRRVYLDFQGVIPTPTEARQFLAETAPDKRAQLIDRLLSSPRYAQRMRQAITVMLLERRAGSVISDEEWNVFVEQAFAANQPWDAFVRALISADGREPQTRPAIRFFVDGGRADAHQTTRDMARIFLAMDIQCAQCHDHPNVTDFHQADYFGLYSFLQQSQTKNDTVEKKPFLIEKVAMGKIDFQSVFQPDQKHAIGPRLPNRPELEVPTFEKGEEFAEPPANGLPGVPKFRPRLRLAEELTAADNERFVRNSVNRFWFHLMGRGLVHPLDMMHDKNPPSHPELLDALAQAFVASGFDVKALLREIALSDAYQRGSVLPDGVAAADVPADRYRVARPRGLSAEQMAYSLMQATGNLERVLTAPLPEKSKFTYKDYINDRLPAPDNRADVMALFEAAFGNPPGEAEVDFRPSVEQSLFLMNEDLLMIWLEPRPGSLLERVSKIADDGAAINELYMSVLTREPTAEEQAIITQYLAENPDRSSALHEIAWSLLTTAEFRLNH